MYVEAARKARKPYGTVKSRARTIFRKCSQQSKNRRAQSISFISPQITDIAFAVSAAFVFGDHLGFAAGFAPEILPAMIVGKLAGGFSAIAVAWLLTRNEQ